MKRPSFALPTLDLQVVASGNKNALIAEESKDWNDFSLGDSRYCQDGLSIGRDFLRFEGVTITRNKVSPDFVSIEETIGRGAFNKVQRAVWSNPETNVQQEVAVKEYASLAGASDQKRQMLIQELHSLCKLDNKCLVKMVGAFLEHNSIVLVLEFLDRGSLEHVLQQRKTPFTLPMLAGAAYQLLKGLEYLHKRRIVHRDVKTENCLMNASGGVKLCDFGLASLGDQSMHSTCLGTTYFMAPERLRAQQYGRSSDIWSLGLILIHLATGNRPWGHVSSMIDLVVTIEETDPNDLIPATMERGVRDIISGCLQLAPHKRMPASILVQSPWFSKGHQIGSIEDASKRILDYECM